MFVVYDAGIQRVDGASRRDISNIIFQKCITNQYAIWHLTAFNRAIIASLNCWVQESIHNMYGGGIF